MVLMNKTFDFQSNLFIMYYFSLFYFRYCSIFWPFSRIQSCIQRIACSVFCTFISSNTRIILCFKCSRLVMVLELQTQLSHRLDARVLNWFLYPLPSKMKPSTQFLIFDSFLTVLFSWPHLHHECWPTLYTQ